MTDALSPAAVDRLSALLERFRVRAHWFHAGPLCGVTPFPAEPGRAFLHVLRRGRLEVTHPTGSGAPHRLTLCEPTLLLYPRALEHHFHHALQEGSDFVCATLAFDGRSRHPLVQALPAVLTLPIAQVDGIAQTLALLFAETAQVRCGQRLLASRLFDVLLLQVLRWLLDHPAESGMPAGLLAGLAHPKLARALTRMHERPGEAWSLAAMAQAAGMSRSAFAAEFRDTLGSTPGDYLLQWRVCVAQTWLHEGRPIQRISDALGYASPAAFSRAFAQVVGASPREWLKAQ